MSSFNLDLKLNFTPTCTIVNDTKDVRFKPEVFYQRYQYVSAVINSHPIIQSHCKKLIEFGCAQMKFFKILKHEVSTVEHIVEVDIDEKVLMANKHRVQPLIFDSVYPRLSPLKVEVYCGSVADPSPVLLGADVVVAIELIEHLYEDTLAALPQNIFGYIQPKVVIFTTPNSEINSIFPGLGAGFRHDDHKFEWTRKEFEDWAAGICEKYPEYSTKFYGIGPGPEGTEHMGCVSQMVVFLRNDLKNLIENGAGDGATDGYSSKPEVPEEEIPNNYKLIGEFKYPVEKRSKEQIALESASFHIKTYERNEILKEEAEGNFDIKVVEIDLIVIFEHVKHLVENNCDNLHEILVKNGFKIEEGKIILEQIH